MGMPGMWGWRKAPLEVPPPLRTQQCGEVLQLLPLVHRMAWERGWTMTVRQILPLVRRLCDQLDATPAGDGDPVNHVLGSIEAALEACEASDATVAETAARWSRSWMPHG